MVKKTTFSSVFPPFSPGLLNLQELPENVDLSDAIEDVHVTPVPLLKNESKRFSLLRGLVWSFFVFFS